MDDCLSCRIVGGELTPTGGTILRSAQFDVHQDYACAIPGFLIVATIRHAPPSGRCSASSTSTTS
jgi:hypothetical protein